MCQARGGGRSRQAGTQTNKRMNQLRAGQGASARMNHGPGGGVSHTLMHLAGLELREVVGQHTSPASSLISVLGSQHNSSRASLSLHALSASVRNVKGTSAQAQCHWWGGGAMTHARARGPVYGDVRLWCEMNGHAGGRDPWRTCIGSTSRTYVSVRSALSGSPPRAPCLRDVLQPAPIKTTPCSPSSTRMDYSTRSQSLGEPNQPAPPARQPRPTASLDSHPELRPQAHQWLVSAETRPTLMAWAPMVTPGAHAHPSLGRPWIRHDPIRPPPPPSPPLSAHPRLGLGWEGHVGPHSRSGDGQTEGGIGRDWQWVLGEVVVGHGLVGEAGGEQDCQMEGSR